MLMQTETAVNDLADELDFATLLEESLAASQLERGDIVNGTVLSIDSQGLIVDIGWKQDGIVARGDIERMGMTTADYQVNAEISVAVVNLSDHDGNLILSAAQARQNEDWLRAEEFMNSETLWTGEIVDTNRGGVIVSYGHLRGFVPASHVLDLPRGMKEDEMRTIADFITEVLENRLEGSVRRSIRAKVKEFCTQFPIYEYVK